MSDPAAIRRSINNAIALGTVWDAGLWQALNGAPQRATENCVEWCRTGKRDTTGRLVARQLAEAERIAEVGAIIERSASARRAKRERAGW